MSQKSLALSLSGGGAKAIAYLAFIDVLREEGIHIDHVLAHSGAAMLMCYWHLASSEEIVDAYSQVKYPSFFRPHLIPQGALLSTQAMLRHFGKVAGEQRIEDIKEFALTITHTDMTDWRNPFTVYQESGLLATEAVISSLVIPLNQVYTRDGRQLVDGGYSSLYSAKYLRKKGAEVVMGLYPSSFIADSIPPIARGIVGISKVQMSLREAAERRDAPADLELDFGDIICTPSQFHKATEVYQKALELSRGALPSLKKLL